MTSIVAKDLVGTRFNVLDKGWVQLVANMGCDADIARSARVSFVGASDEQQDVERDTRLVRYLMQHSHTSPFEMCEMKFYIKMPIFVARQFLRHRTANVNEISGRYSVLSNDYYLPEYPRFATQSKLNMQNSSDDYYSKEASDKITSKIKKSLEDSFALYEELLSFKDGELEGISREVARIVLPLATYTEFVWKCDLHNILRLIRLRIGEGAQPEIREYANAIMEFVKKLYPVTYQAYLDFVIGSFNISRKAKDYLANYLNNRENNVELSRSDRAQLESIYSGFFEEA